jgi:hypothetical protein
VFPVALQGNQEWAGTRWPIAADAGGRGVAAQYSGVDDDESEYIQGNKNNHKHTYAGQLNSFTRLRALLVLHDRGICWPRQLASH